MVATRRATADDVGFIADAWLKSFRGAHASGPLQPDLYFAAYREQVSRLLTRARTEVRVAEHDGVLLGFLVLERWVPAVVHYVYVKDGREFTGETYRGRGICRELFKAAGVGRPWIYTFRTPDGAALARAWGGRYDPNFARFEGPKRETHVDDQV